MKQAITLGRTLDAKTFALPCVAVAQKNEILGYFLILYPSMMADGNFHWADPGDTLIEEDNGKWRVEKKFKKASYDSENI